MKKTLGLTLICALLAGCGGGGGVTPSTPPVHGGSTGSQTAQVKLGFTFNTHSGGAHIRGRKYTSRNTAGIGISVQASGSSTDKFASPTSLASLQAPDAALAVAAGEQLNNIGCTQAANDGSFTCTVVMPVPAGYDDFQITEWDAAPGTGPNYFASAHDLSTAVIRDQLVYANQNNTFNYTLGGVVSSVSLQLTTNSLVAGAALGSAPNPSSVDLNVLAKDYQGNVIIGNDPFVDVNGNPVTVTVNSPSQTVPAWLPSNTAVFVQTTYVDAAGESTPSSEATLTTGAQGRVTVTSPAVDTVGPNTATGYNVYASTTTGTETLLNPSPVPIGQSYDIATAPSGAGPVPPSADASGLGSPASPNLAFGSPIPTGNVAIAGTTSFTAPQAPGATTVSYDGGDLVNATFGASIGTTGPSIPVTGATLMFTRTVNGGLGVPGPLQITESGGDSAERYAALDLNGNLWFGSANGLTEVAPGGATSVASGSAYPAAAVALGPDGNMWATTAIAGTGYLMKYAGGTYTNYPSSGSLQGQTIGITRGGDNNLWFTELNDSNQTKAWIGVMDTFGNVKAEYPLLLPAGANSITNIVYGPDGNYWTGGTGYIAKIAPDGSPTYLQTGSPYIDSPTDFAVGPDKDIWFADVANGALGRVVTSADTTGGTAGTVTEYPIADPTRYSTDGVAYGADGNFWVTLHDNLGTNDEIARVTTAGHVTMYTRGWNLGGWVNGIAAGSDGEIYFGEYLTGNIGEVHLH